VRRGAIRLALLAGGLLAASPAPAQDGAGPTELEEQLGRPRRTPVIPPALRPLVREATRDRIVVRGLRGDIFIDIREYEPERFQQFGDGRFLGFAFMGYEHYGYQLIDRAMAPEEAVIATGETPVFSPDGRYFAAVQFSGAGWGNLEAFALWEVSPQGARQRLFDAALPAGEDWRVDGWPREDCVALSAAPPGAAGGGEPGAERLRISVEVGERIALDGTTSPPCGVTDATRHDG
jgi:hypothetical protein